MKARIPKKNSNYNPDSIGVPKKLLEDSEYAKEFWNYLTQANPDKDYGDNFEAWYDKLNTYEFTRKVRRIDGATAIRNNAKSVKNNNIKSKKGGG